MKYPYIGKGSRSGAVFLFFKDSEALVLDPGSSAYFGCVNNICETLCRNITAEYLANKKVKPASDKHQKFIVKLIQVNGLDYFTSADGCLHITKERNGNTFYAKQITIPLPPECESVDEWPKVGSSVEWGHTGKGEVKSLSDGFAWIKLDNKDYTTVYVSSLRKPKTPEQELRDELVEFIDESNQMWVKKDRGNIDSTTVFEFISDALLSRFEITKKPQ